MISNKIFRKSYFGRVDLTCYAFVLPILVLYITFSIFPIIRTFMESFFTGNIVIRGPFIGLSNYISIIQDRLFQQAFLNTIVFTVFSMILSVSFAVIVGVMVNSPNIRFQTIFKVIYFLPVVTSFVAVGYIWKWMYDPCMGIINRVLSGFGIEGINWLGNPHLAMMSLILVNVWKWVGYFMIIIIAYLQLIDNDLYEAALIDGAGLFQVFFRITLPLLNTAIVLCLVLGMINFLRTFAIVLVMTQGGPGGRTEVITTFVYNQAFGTGRMRIGYSASASMILFLIIMVLTLMLSKVKKGDR